MRRAVVLVFAGSGLWAAEAFREDFDHGIGSAWKSVTFEGKTQHLIVKEGTNAVLQARAESSASGLAVKLDGIRAKRATLTFRWKIDRIPPNGSDHEIKTFDHTARLFVAFKTLLGPPRTINYVWANQAPAQTTFHHPNSRRSRFIALHSGNSEAGKWFAHERDISADWKLLFGGEDVPEIVGLGFMTDSDGTKTAVTGWYDEIVLTTR